MENIFKENNLVKYDKNLFRFSERFLSEIIFEVNDVNIFPIKD